MGACPFLGLEDDHTIMLSEPSQMHRCYAVNPARTPAQRFQTQNCLVDAHVACSLYKSAGIHAAQQRAASSVPVAGSGSRRGLLAIAALALVVLVGAGYVISGQGSLRAFGIPSFFGGDVAQSPIVTTPSPAAVAFAVAGATAASENAAATALPEPTLDPALAAQSDASTVALDTAEPATEPAAAPTDAPTAAPTVAPTAEPTPTPTAVAAINAPATATAAAAQAATATQQARVLEARAQQPTATLRVVAARASNTPVASPTLDATEPPALPPAQAPTNTTASVAQAATATPEQATTEASPTPRALTFTPVLGEAGWLESQVVGIAGLGNSFLYAGRQGENVLISGMRFDLSRVERGAPLLGGSLTLTGMVDDRLASELGGSWRVQFIAENELASLTDVDFMMLFSAPASITSLRDLAPQDLARGSTNTWEFDTNVLRWLEAQLLQGATSFIARVTSVEDQPGDTLFAWDSGTGEASQGNPPVLELAVGAAPPTPPPLPTREYLVATMTPAPLNVVTLVAQQATMTAVAETIGTNTPMPPFVTPTPVAENLPTLQALAILMELPAVAQLTPTPANAVEATANAEFATAVALTTGTYTPVPEGFVTPFVVLPSPPAQNIATEAARAVEATAAAANVQETRTPMPHNAIVGEWITATPTAENVATAAALNIQATRAVDELGRPTPTPFHWLVITETPTPLPTSTPTIPPVIFSADFTATPIPTATEFIPATLPNEYRNLVFFQRGAGPQPETWLVNPATGETGRVTREWIYPMARRSLTLSPNGAEEVFVRSNADGIPEIYIRAVGSTRERKLTDFSRPSYDPAWSPTGEWISFVSSNSGNDEIYRVSPDGSVLQQLTNNNWEWDKHPSWSPDGSQIVFFSNRDVGRTQIWIMNADGSGQRRLVESDFEDMYPVWAR